MGVASLIYAFTSFLIFVLCRSVIFNSFFIPPYFHSFCYSRHIFCDCFSYSDDPDDPKPIWHINSEAEHVVLFIYCWHNTLSLQVILHQSVTFPVGILILYFDVFNMQMHNKLKVYMRFSKIYESMWYYRSFLYPIKSSESFWL